MLRLGSGERNGLVGRACNRPLRCWLGLTVGFQLSQTERVSDKRPTKSNQQVPWYAATRDSYRRVGRAVW